MYSFYHLFLLTTFSISKDAQNQAEVKGRSSYLLYKLTQLRTINSNTTVNISILPINNSITQSTATICYCSVKCSITLLLSNSTAVTYLLSQLSFFFTYKSFNQLALLQSQQYNCYHRLPFLEWIMDSHLNSRNVKLRIFNKQKFTSHYNPFYLFPLFIFSLITYLP